MNLNMHLNLFAITAVEPSDNLIYLNDSTFNFINSSLKKILTNNAKCQALLIFEQLQYLLLFFSL